MMNMAKYSHSIWVVLLLVQCLVGGVLCRRKARKDKEFEFFYFVQLWPGAQCDTKSECCYPTTGKPASDFGIHGLWPTYNDGSYPRDCDTKYEFNFTQVEDVKGRLEKDWPTLGCPSANGIKFWKHEWNKHGTCSKSVLTQHDYFKEALDLKHKVNLLKVLNDAGIVPNDEFYELENIKESIKKGLGYYPKLLCNRDLQGNSQIYQVYVCVGKDIKNLIKCPVPLRGNCPPRVQFPKF